MADHDYHPFEIVTEYGDRAEADDEASALFAARTLRDDYRGTTSGKFPEIYILFNGTTVLTIPRTGCV